MITAWLTLWLGASALPDVRPERVVPAVVAAEIEATPRTPAALLIALAWGESRLESDVITGSACGVMQVQPHDLGEPFSACASWRASTRAGMRAGVRELEMLLADRRVHGDLRRALLYRACGNVAFTGGCTAAKIAWVDAALARYRALLGSADAAS